MTRRNIGVFFLLLLFYAYPYQTSHAASSDQNMSKKEFQQNVKNLTPLQQQVTQNNGTEPPFENEFWNNKKDGIYVDILSGKPLFS